MTETPPKPPVSTFPRMLSACLVWGFVFFLHVYVLPRMMVVLESTNASLPHLTREVLRASMLIREFGLAAAATGVVAVALLLTLAWQWRSRGCRILANVLLLFGTLAAALIILSILLTLSSLARAIR